MKITLVTVCLDSAATLRDTVESVARQRLDDMPAGECPELEYLVIDGGSKDGTIGFLREFAERCRLRPDPRFSFRWLSERDNGLYDAINKGIRLATGDVIGICNADDVLADDGVVARVAAAFGKDGEATDAVYADVRFVKGSDGVDALREAPVTRYCSGRFFRNWMFRFAVFPAHPGTFVRRDCFLRYGLYSPDYRICADFEMMLRLFCRHRIRTRYLPVCTHVMRTGGLSTDGFGSNVRINREDLRALRANGFRSWLPLLYLKYPFKLTGVVFRRWHMRAMRVRENRARSGF